MCKKKRAEANSLCRIYQSHVRKPLAIKQCPQSILPEVVRYTLRIIADHKQACESGMSERTLNDSNVLSLLFAL